MLDNIVVGYIWQKYPVLFIISVNFDEVKYILRSYQFIKTIKARSLSEKNFKVHIDTLKNTFDGLNRECFSAEDFWFYTNS